MKRRLPFAALLFLAACKPDPNTACPFNSPPPVSQITPTVFRAAPGVCFDLSKLPPKWRLVPRYSDHSWSRSVEAQVLDVADVPGAEAEDLLGISFGAWFDACQGNLWGTPEQNEKNVAEGISRYVGPPMEDSAGRWTFIQTRLKSMQDDDPRAVPFYHESRAGIGCSGVAKVTLEHSKYAPIRCSHIDRGLGWGFAYLFPARLQTALPDITSPVMDAIAAMRVPCPP